MKTQFDDGEVQGYWEMIGQTMHINFYGSNQPEDWVADFMAFKVPGLNVHAGFLAYVGRALHLVQQITLDYSGNDLWITGHSLGGAIAQGVASILQGRRQVRITTAGSPRYGGLWWWLTVGRKIDHTRYVVKGDIVPSLAPWWLGWKHCGIKIVIDRPDIPFTKFQKHLTSAYSSVPFDL
jgi:predicted lipase